MKETGRKKLGWTGRLLCGMLLLCLMAGAAAEGWPAESRKDGEGKTIKTVPTGDGKTEVWEYVGIFGSREEALQLVGLKEENEEKPEGGVVQIAGKKIKAKKKKKDELPLKFSDGDEWRLLKALKTPSRRKKKNRVIDVVDYTPPDRPLIYIQDNRGSGR